MRLSKIYASKLYITSSRKDRIHAAIASPFNAELVQQLSEYLDDDAKEKLEDAVEEKIETNEANSLEPSKNAADSSGFLDTENNAFSPSYAEARSSHSADSASSEPNIFDIPEEDTSNFSSAPSPEPATESTVEEATELKNTSITADTNICDIMFDIASQIEIIKDTLNSRGDTAGVQRINIDDKELWIYYKDEVNIGDIMVDVIETLNGTNYTYLTFSRLARSNNAIVFDINLNMQEPVKTVKEVEEENI